VPIFLPRPSNAHLRGQLSSNVRPHKRDQWQPPKQSFSAEANSPGHWLRHAHSLKSSSDLVCAYLPKSIEDFKGPPVSPRLAFLDCAQVSQMLLGMSLEALLKGLLVASGTPVASGGLLKRELASHDLKWIAANLEYRLLILSDEDRAHLAELSEFVTWAGRYPIPKQARADYSVGYFVKRFEMQRALWSRLNCVLLPFATLAHPSEA
jgi:hypothetical protein